VVARSYSTVLPFPSGRDGPRLVGHPPPFLLFSSSPYVSLILFFPRTSFCRPTPVETISKAYRAFSVLFLIRAGAEIPFFPSRPSFCQLLKFFLFSPAVVRNFCFFDPCTAPFLSVPVNFRRPGGSPPSLRGFLAL